MYKCFIFLKKMEFYLIGFYIVFNVFFVFLFLIEILYILKLGVCCSMKNKDFVMKYLKGIKEEDEMIYFINDRGEEVRYL